VNTAFAKEHAMQITRIEFRSGAGSIAIERAVGSSTIRIDSIIAEPKKEQAWMTWELPARVGGDELFEVAEVVQRRSDGHVGTNSMIHDYFREMQRFAD
jgi:hypothetical protein